VPAICTRAQITSDGRQSGYDPSDVFTKRYLEQGDPAVQLCLVVHFGESSVEIRNHILPRQRAPLLEACASAAAARNTLGRGCGGCNTRKGKKPALYAGSPRRCRQYGTRHVTIEKGRRPGGSGLGGHGRGWRGFGRTPAPMKLEPFTNADLGGLNVYVFSV
jgi:hypothetical protein